MHLNYLSNVATYFLLALCSALILLNINWTRHSSTCLGKYLRLGLLPSAPQQRHLQCDIVKPPSWIPNNLVQLFKRVQLISDCPELAPLDSSIGRLVVFHSDTEVWPITLNLIHEVLQKPVLVNHSTEARVATGLTGGVRGGGGNRGLGLSGYAWSENKWLLNQYFTVPKIWNFFTRYFLLLLLFVQPV